MSFSTIVLLVLGGAGAIYALTRVAFWRSEGDRVLTPGHITPTPSLAARIICWFAGKLFKFLFVGPVRVIGRHNLGYYGRLVALGNHVTERDAILATWLLGGRPLRYFIANNQASGSRAPLVAFTGGIVVDDTSITASASALLAAIRTMKREEDSSFLIFPQGRLVRSNNLVRSDFKAGAVLLAREAARDSEMPMAYLPFAIYYDRDPSHATAFHTLVNRWLGRKNFRRFFGEVVYGATIIIDQPIPVEILPDDRDQAMDVLYQRVCLLSERAERIGRNV